MYEVFIALPVWFQISFVFIFGAIIGSFLDVYLLRFNTGRSINGRSHCLSCGHELRWFELLPVVSYLALRGRCLVCGSHIPQRLLLMELLTGGLFIYVYLSSFSVFTLLTNLFLVILLWIIVIYDLRHMIIPDRLTILVSLVILLMIGFTFNSFQEWINWWPNLLAAIGAFGFLASLWFVSKGRWIGFGDAKLAAPLGFILGPTAAFSFVVFSFWIGAVVSLGLLGGQRLLSGGQKHLPFLREPLKMKSEVPFAPFMITAFLLVYLSGLNVLQLLDHWFYENPFLF